MKLRPDENCLVCGLKHDCLICTLSSANIRRKRAYDEDVTTRRPSRDGRQPADGNQGGGIP